MVRGCVPVHYVDSVYISGGGGQGLARVEERDHLVDQELQSIAIL